MIRRVVFELAAEQSREKTLATAASQLGLDATRIEALPFADRPQKKLLVAPSAPATTSGLSEAYNLALVQSLLARSAEVSAVVRSNLRRVVGYWTEEYLADKRAMMHAARVPLVMRIEERHTDPEISKDPRVIVFKKRIDVHFLLRACERALATVASTGLATAASS